MDKKKISLKKRIESKFKYSNLLKYNLPYPDNKFVMYTRGRTGSTVLTDLINCHPEIYCDVEIFNFLYSNTKVKYPRLYINSCSKRASVHKKNVYGFKVKIGQLMSEHKYADYDKLLIRLHQEGWKYIYLKRVNFLRHQLSNIVAAGTNVYHLKNGEQKHKEKITVKCEQLLRGIEYGEKVEKKEEENLKHISHLTLIYENDIEDNSRHQETADKVFSFLGLESVRVKTDFKRIIPDKLEDTILNYDEVYNFFKDTEYFKYLK